MRRTAGVPAAAVALVAVAVMPAGYNVFGPVKLLVTMVAAALACRALARDADAQVRIREVAGTPVGRASLALLGAAVLSLATTADPRLAVAGPYPAYAGLIAAAAWLALGAASAAADPDTLRVTLGRAVALATIGVGVLAVVQRFGLDPLSSSGTTRVASTLGNASNLGVWLALAAPPLLDRALAESGRWRAVAWAALALAGASAAFTGSRGGWLGLAAGVALWLAFPARPGPLRARFAPVLVVLLTFALALVLTPAAAERAAGGGTAADTATGRVAVWRSTLPMIAERPVLGWGVASYGRVHPRYAAPAEVDPTGRTESLDDPHNLVLSMTAACGIVGAIALLTLVGACIAATWRGGSTGGAGWARVAGASLAGGFVALQFHFVTLESGAFLAVLVGALAAAQRGGGARRFAGRTVGPLAMVASVAFVSLAVAAAGIVAADVRVRDGFAAAAAGDTKAASRAFDAAERLAPWEPAVVWARGKAAIDGGGQGGGGSLLESGAAALERAAARMPGDGRPLRDLGDLHVAGALGAGDGAGTVAQWAAAIDSYDAALALAPLDPRALLGRGVAHAALGREADAERDLRLAVELAPDFADAWRNLGSFYESVGRNAEAVAAQARAQALAE